MSKYDKRLMISFTPEDLQRLNFCVENERCLTKSEAISELLYAYCEWTNDKKWKEWRKKYDQSEK